MCLGLSETCAVVHFMIRSMASVRKEQRQYIHHCLTPDVVQNLTDRRLLGGYLLGGIVVKEDGIKE